MPEVRFYHLSERPLEAVLPVMLERTLERGWRALVRGTDAERLEALSTHLWTWREDSFLPHGTPADGAPERQPVLLTTEAGNPNAADVLFLVEAAEADLEELRGWEMTAVLFRDADPRELAHARALWRQVATAGLAAVYWAEDGRGGWVRRHATGG